MGFAPGLGALDVMGTTEIVRILRASRPTLLIFTLSRLLTGGFRAGVLVVAATRIGVV